MTFNPADVVKRSRGVSQQLNTGVGFLLKKNKVDVIWGEAEITKPGEVKVSARRSPLFNRRTRSQRHARKASTARKTSLSPLARGRACCRALSPTAS